MPTEVETQQTTTQQTDSAALKTSLDAAFKHKPEVEQRDKTVTTTETTIDQTPVKKDAQEPPDKGGGIKALRGEVEARGEEIKTLRAQLTEFDGTKKERDELKSRIGDLEKRGAEYKKLESVSALETSDAFQSKYIQGRNKHIDRLKELASYAEVSPDDLMSALAKKGKDRVTAMEEILSSTGRYIGEDIVQTVKTIDALDSERASELANASEVVGKRLAEREASTRQRREEQTRVRNEAWDSATARLGAELGLTDEQRATATEFYKNNKDAGKAAEMVLKGHAADALVAQVAQLTAELKKYQGANPDLQSSSQANGGDDDSKLSFTQRINKKLSEQGFSARK